MSFLEKLPDGLEVEWKALGEIVKTVTAPAKLKRESYRDVGKTPIIDQGVNFIAGYTDEDVKALPCNEYVIFGDHSEHIKYVDFSFIQGADGLKILKTVSDVSKYIYYAFQNFYQKELNYKRHWSRASETLIPIPCPENPEKSLEIQAEIVRILDAFAELTAELTARKKQYNYYRDQLLSFPCSSVGTQGEVEWKTLGEMAVEFGRGKSRHRPRNDPKLYGGNTPFIQTGDIRNASHIITEYSQTYSDFGLTQSKLWPKGTLCITIAANIAETTILGFDSCFPDSVIGFVANPEKTNSSYVEYLLSSFKTKLQSQSTGSAQENINMGTFESMRLPFPPLQEQNRIVTILDKFDTLTNSISEGLPREIALRQKQYEYYRDLLLSFPKAKPETPLECGEITWIRSAK